MDEIRAKIKLTEAKLRALKNRLKESRVSASEDKVYKYIESVLNKILRRDVVEEERVAYDDMDDPREYLAQWFANSMDERMAYVLQKAFFKGFPADKILSAFKRITMADENYDEMNAWLNKRTAKRIERAFGNELKRGVM